jgi:GlcNAc-PI de-N-acetylase
MTRHLSFSLFLILSSRILMWTQSQAPALPQPDQRYKVDILLVVGHPDDDIEVAAYLAKAIEQGHKRAAVVYMTRGNSGGNAVGLEQAKALADVREMECLVSAWLRYSRWRRPAFS